VLLEQLAHPHFKNGFVTYLDERAAWAERDAREFESENDPTMAALARRWQGWYGDRLAHFLRIKRDIPKCLARHRRAGLIEILTSPATHAYLPLLLHDESIRAQLRAGVTASERAVGARSGGVWLPECAYRPSYEQWQPPVLDLRPRFRPGIESLLADEGLTHFFVDTHLVHHGQPLAVIKTDGVHATSDALVFWDIKRGWGNVLDPVGVVSEPAIPSCYAFARHPNVSEQVWSAVKGYPGAAEYLEFHRRHGEQGLRYHRVTDHHTPIDQKKPYDPDLIAGKVYENAHHFCSVVRETLTEYSAMTGRTGTILAPFDAELFGHWWFEGPRFLRDVLLTLAHDGTVELSTPQRALRESPPDKVVRMPEGSWGEGGHHQVWLNDRTRWLWEMEYRAEARFLDLLRELPWRHTPNVKRLLESAGRELLLLQSSDWPFVIHSGGATDYGVTRFAGHATRFDRLATLANAAADGAKVNAVQKTEVDEAEAHDTVFEKIELAWWE
jgi:1,4-alpha-glucan branching enzyme